MGEFQIPFFKRTEIPPVFWSDLNQRPFENCISCERYLLDGSTEYMIEKALQSTAVEGSVSTIFEYAMCVKCADQLRAQLSIESINNINQFYATRTNFEERREQLMNNAPKVEEWLNECIVNKRPFQLGEEYQIYAQCIGKEFLYLDTPFMVSGSAIEEMIELISAETMDELDNFKNNLTTSPPEFKALLESGGAKVFI